MATYSNSFPAAFRRQLAIISALIIREMTTRYGNKFGGYLWAILDPVLTIAIMTAIFSAIARVPPLGRSFVLFFATGYFSFYVYRSMQEQVSKAVSSNRALLAYPIVQPYDAIVSRTILQIATLFVVSIILFGTIATFTAFPSLNLIPILTSASIAIVLGVGVGAANIVWFHLSSTYNQVWNVINRPAFMVSGVFFLPENIPSPYREILMWNPMIHVVGLFRQGFYPNYRAAYIDMQYIVGLAIFSLIFGFILVWMFDGKLREPQ
jgi:capsular polysaccharide transport system permease protein